ncbi:hypothetical protein SEA_TAPIOCA_69 [Mycobacterium phage Tapioca]|uniref:Uncharacterized protein n=10 Tax=Caudoviricetes TaxID=2731619 RepID=A0A142K7Z2_9CAUD|nr:hypothetical protein AVV74_gp70 [Mycobacterium phage Carcharodon]YP_009616925.1 hypothetical protein FDI84_gp72 [Mycobacterium phage Pipsqueaks]YP_010052002.1 HNH endonuclease [Mycobacterium phage Aggie]YP_010052342.1 hypothetical protein KD934_gp69 [Mycobacterium phage Tapioca]AMS02017.1 hypothetical protein SEA_XERXES_71 [Mycobacterium phage Xerxes]AWY04152.1 hypothetical protein SILVAFIGHTER_73 [Mycobacterium phage Silvafighter]AYQ98295.1 hypothetical protein SEA_CHEWBACCA_73 [Mycobacte
MSHIRVTLDGNTIMDGDPGQWATKPPAIADLELRAASGNPEPWVQILTAFARAAVTGRNTTITATTRDNGWTLDVEHHATS